MSFSCTRAQTINAASCNASDVQAALKLSNLINHRRQHPRGQLQLGHSSNIYGYKWKQHALDLRGCNLTTTGGGDATVIIDNYSGTSSLWQTPLAPRARTFGLLALLFKAAMAQ